MNLLYDHGCRMWAGLQITEYRSLSFSFDQGLAKWLLRKRALKIYLHLACHSECLLVTTKPPADGQYFH